MNSKLSDQRCARDCRAEISFGNMSDSESPSKGIPPLRSTGAAPVIPSRSYGDMLAADASQLDARLLQEERRASTPGNSRRGTETGGADEQTTGPFMFPPSAAGHFAEVSGGSTLLTPVLHSSLYSIVVQEYSIMIRYYSDP